jgi:putative DNA primase/helicase
VIWDKKFASRAKTYVIQTPSTGARALYWTKEDYPGKPFADTLRMEYHGNNQYVALWGWAKNNRGERGEYIVFNQSPILVDDNIVKDTTTMMRELLAGKYRFLSYPCVKEHLKKGKKNIFLDHNQSLAINFWMIKNGCTHEELHNFRRKVVDHDKIDPKKIVEIYDKDVTNSQIKNGVSYVNGGGKQRSCFSRHEGKPSVCEIFEYSGVGCGQCPWRIENKLGQVTQYKPTDFFNISETTGRMTFIPKRLGDVIKAETRIASLGRHLSILFYDESKGVWVDQGERIIRNRAYELLDEYATRSRVEEVVSYIQDTSFIDIDTFDRDPSRLPVANGTLNLLTGDLEEHNPELYAITYLPRIYDTTKDCPETKRIISQIVAVDDIDTIQEWFGYHLWREYFIRAALLLLGGGGNGKSTLLRLLSTFLGGRKNVVNYTLEEILHDRFAKADLYGKLGNIAADISAKELTDTGKFKASTGADYMQGQHKYQNSFSFVNTAKLSYSANLIPKTSDLTEAFFERWLPVTCPNKFIAGENADPHILKKIITEDELSGLLNWSLKGLKRILKNGLFTNSKTAAEVQTLWEEASDSITSFANKCVSQDTNQEIIKRELHLIYCNYCNSRKFVSEGVIAFGRAIGPKLSFEIKETQPTIEKKRVECWKGIKMNCPNCPTFVDNLPETDSCRGCRGCRGCLYLDSVGRKKLQTSLVETNPASGASGAGEVEKPEEQHEGNVPSVPLSTQEFPAPPKSELVQPVQAQDPLLEAEKAPATAAGAASGEPSKEDKPAQPVRVTLANMRDVIIQILEAEDYSVGRLLFRNLLEKAGVDPDAALYLIRDDPDFDVTSISVSYRPPKDPGPGGAGGKEVG